MNEGSLFSQVRINVTRTTGLGFNSANLSFLLKLDIYLLPDLQQSSSYKIVAEERLYSQK